MPWTVPQPFPSTRGFGERTPGRLRRLGCRRASAASPLIAPPWEELLEGFASRHIYLFSRETLGDDATVHSRMFGPAAGVPEDPATGSAAGPLGCYLIHHGLVPAGERVPIVCEQGYEIGRPSRMEIEISGDRAEIREVRVGGGCVLIGEGRMRLPQ